MAPLLPAVVAALTQRLEPLLHARPAPRGATAVVFAPAVAGVLVHELLGHALEADRALAGSWLARRTGEVAQAGLIVIDDPRRGRMGWRFDDEGEPARPTVLLRDGTVRGWLVDQRHALPAGCRPSGHGRRSSFREPVRPRMGCTFMAAGTLGAGEVAEGTTGIYVRRMEVAHTDPVRGHAVFRVTDADRIETGRITVAVRPHLLVIDGVAALSGIDRIGDDLGFDACVGTCHGHAQPLAVSVGAPTIRLRLASVVS
jgi:TldD protein